ncbi:putative protein of unknown function (DUF3342) [Trypanosoma cruzi]|uniref:SANT and BTB domain-containing protein n=1 Tax=Trypanosoma cruzi TaxID=5693 RepID=A0A7J6Y3D8_TRYCR|nr:hypothetical protein ECC02_006302 [Trypanosoma cruzi]KAF8275939.1 putative protein of unknown function (DUF3342) [Trypanosoma cruzi]
MARKAENGRMTASGLGGGTTPSATPPPREVEVTVYDKLLNEVRTFRCHQHLLETSMAYFEPIIRRYLEEEAEEEKKRIRAEIEKGRDSNFGASAATKLETSIGVTDGSADKKAIIGTRGQGDVGPSSKISGKTPLPPIPIRVNCDLSIFSWLMAYIEGKGRPFTPENAVSIALSSNFLLMTQLVDLPLQYIKENLVQVMLSGVNMECLTGELLARLCTMLSEGDLARAFLRLFDWRAEYSANRRFLTALLRHVVCDRLGERRAGGLRWCQYCGVLFDQHELLRLERSGKNVKPALCPRLTKSSIGTRGEILTTHVASKQPANLAFPSISWSDEHVERWAWRIIGATYFFLCRQCNHLVSLIDTTTHGCSGGVAAFSCVEGGNRADSEALLAWYDNSKYLYVGGLNPIYSRQTDVPREFVLTLSPMGDWTCEDGGDCAVPGLWCTHPIAVERSVDTKGRVSLDTQNGFERWLMLELQQMMEDFGAGGKTNASVSDAQTPIPPSKAPTTNFALQSSLKTSNRGTEYMAGPGARRTSYRGNRVESRSGFGFGNDVVNKRKETINNNGIQRVKAPSGGAHVASDSNKNNVVSSFSNSARVRSAQSSRPSARKIINFDPESSGGNSFISQAQRQ